MLPRIGHGLLADKSLRRDAWRLNRAIANVRGATHPTSEAQKYILGVLHQRSKQRVGRYRGQIAEQAGALGVCRLTGRSGHVD
jgi:hypothetical protein